jgi:NodT family efflux transporter outer membrane factor (OMF) lipoprotein
MNGPALALRALLVGAALAAGGCALGPDFARPPAPAVQRYGTQPSASASAPADGVAQRFASGPATPRWWSAYGSATLDGWVDEGLAHNRDLQAAVASLVAAGEQLRAQTGASLLPSVTGQLEYAHQRAIGLPDFGPPTVLYQLYAGTVQVSYDLDLFGGIRRANEAARAQVDVQAQELAAARQTLAANIVITAIRSAALQREAQIRAHIAELAERRAQLTLRRYELGGTSHREALDAARAAHAASAALPGLRAQSDRARHALAVLLGRLPQDAPADLDFETLRLPAELPVAVPSELVHERPDILAAEAGLHAATARVGVATANLFPKLSLTGSFGSESFTRAGFLHPATGVWGASGGLLEPLFAGGALLAQKRAASAELDAAYRRYESTVLKAFGNVADALRTLEEDAQTLVQNAQAEGDAERFYQETLRRHDQGSENIIAVLASEQALLQERLARLGGQDARLIDTASLFQAIGAPDR